jgi:hypothetical protein
MQAPSRNRRSDRGGSVTPKRQVAALFTLPLVRQRNPRPLTHAIVAVGLAVAAADYGLRCGDLRAESRLSRAGTGEVDDEALSGLSLTEQARGYTERHTGERRSPVGRPDRPASPRSELHTGERRSPVGGPDRPATHRLERSPRYIPLKRIFDLSDQSRDCDDIGLHRSVCHSQSLGLVPPPQSPRSS